MIWSTVIYEEKVIAISKLEIIFHPFMVTITTPAQNHPKVEFQTKTEKTKLIAGSISLFLVFLPYVQMPASLHTEV